MTTQRGTSNTNDRGSAESRRRRREWLVETYRADVDVMVEEEEVVAFVPAMPDPAGWTKACRCYRCGRLLTVETVTVDRIVPGCLGGRYVRSNIRPACGPCNSETGGRLGAERKREKV